ncbi:hypothetical protein PAMC26510_34460 [Caballeronia sordidicola]|uniref:Uncharacterized protein n=1 Tax=Caballeronia sordidicola TaxID=196367 RepID=A0A242M6X6_CABSO|nr:hypothetical protein PAMC26510_34460 [Caballeronia sordidicola]
MRSFLSNRSWRFCPQSGFVPQEALFAPLAEEFLGRPESVKAWLVF